MGLPHAAHAGGLLLAEPRLRLGLQLLRPLREKVGKEQIGEEHAGDSERDQGPEEPGEEEPDEEDGVCDPAQRSGAELLHFRPRGRRDSLDKRGGAELLVEVHDGVPNPFVCSLRAWRRRPT